MKNILILLISIVSISFVSCDGGMHGQPDGSYPPSGGPQVSGSVQIHIGGGNNGGIYPSYPTSPATIGPVLIGRVYKPVTKVKWFTDWNLQPTDRYKLVVELSSGQMAEAAVTLEMISQIDSHLSFNSYNYGEVTLSPLVGSIYAVYEITSVY